MTRHDTKGVDQFRVCYLDDHEERQEMFIYATTLKGAFIDAKDALDAQFGQSYLITDCRLNPAQAARP